MNRLLLASTALLGALLVSSARGDTFGSGANTFTIDFVSIGDPGNASDRAADSSNDTPNNPNDDEYAAPYGGVSYSYRIGTYEISEDMIAKANTLGGLRITKDTRSATQAASGVTWNEAARFVNWLNTSQGYSVAYKFALNPGDAGYTSNTQANENLVLWTVSDAGYDAANLYRNRNAHYFLPSVDEWYKAAFYSGSGSTYYDYATASNMLPTAVVSGTGAGTAVYNAGTVTAPADIMQAGGLSHYGTMAQNGNVHEWQETALTPPNDSPSETRMARGGGWISTEQILQPWIASTGPPAGGSPYVGLRVASVPEPSCLMLMIGSGMMLLLWRRRAAAR